MHEPKVWCYALSFSFCKTKSKINEEIRTKEKMKSCENKRTGGVGQMAKAPVAKILPQMDHNNLCDLVVPQMKESLFYIFEN
jgi:hypothetical protein